MALRCRYLLRCLLVADSIAWSSWRPLRRCVGVVAGLALSQLTVGCGGPPTSTASGGSSTSGSALFATTPPKSLRTPDTRSPETRSSDTGATITTWAASVLSAPVTGTSVQPEPIQPVFAPALNREGQWDLLASTATGPAVWGTTIRPLGAQPTVVASYAIFDQNRLHAALFNGTQLPGGGPWTNGSTVAPAAMSALIAVFNGGFKFHDMQGGYFTEGRVIKPLLDGEATIAIATDGRLSLGVYGQDFTNDGSWVSLRQNLPLIVDGGHESVSTAHEPGVAHVYWGADYGGVMLDLRSALCQRFDGLMMYAVVGKVDVRGLANALVDAGCSRAMELDMNGTWPQFTSFDPGTGRIGPIPLDARMSHLDRYLTAGAAKDFVALFDPGVLPPNVVR